MRILSIDLETYSNVNLQKSGLYKYVQSPDFEILLFAYAYDDGPVQIVDLACRERIPYQVLEDLNAPDVEKHAYNAAFEYYCLSKFYRTSLDQWHCTMVHGLYCGYPGSLAGIGDALGLPREKKKMAEGKSLIRYFCCPCAPTKRNGGRTRNLASHDLKKWELFKTYCMQDVETERTVAHRLSGYPIPDNERSLWIIDQIINIGGVALDGKLIQGALTISARMTEELSGRARELTGLENPNSVARLKEWIEANADVRLESLNKQTVAELIADRACDDAVQTVLRIRQEMAKTSVKKYEAMQAAVCEDGRVRGLLQFYGANRTGRWAGRLVQVQNLPRNYLESIDTARTLVRNQKTEALRLIYGNVPDTLSQLVRTAFVPGKGCHFAVADFSAIEARVIAWLAKETWRLDVFNTHGKIYEASASAMFGVPIDRIRKGNPEYALRAKGKVAELALGYQGSSGALIQMGALNMGLSEEDLPDIVQRWRASNRRIVDLWYAVENAAVRCVEFGAPAALPCGIHFIRDEGRMMVILPSGRRLFYTSPQLIPDERGYRRLYFMGVSQSRKRWELIQTYGGKLTENIVQAVARDCLANAIQNLHHAGYRINFHIHDEVILEIPDNSGQSLEEAIEIMCRVPDWAEGLPLGADGFESRYYKKD